MDHDSNHELTYDYEGDAIAARCSCGGWAWDKARSTGSLPLQVFTAIQAEHRRHVKEAEGRSLNSPEG